MTARTCGQLPPAPSGHRAPEEEVDVDRAMQRDKTQKLGPSCDDDKIRHYSQKQPPCCVLCKLLEIPFRNGNEIPRTGEGPQKAHIPSDQKKRDSIMATRSPGQAKGHTGHTSCHTETTGGKSAPIEDRRALHTMRAKCAKRELSVFKPQNRRSAPAQNTKKKHRKPRRLDKSIHRMRETFFNRHSCKMRRPKSPPGQVPRTRLQLLL